MSEPSTSNIERFGLGRGQLLKTKAEAGPSETQG